LPLWKPPYGRITAIDQHRRSPLDCADGRPEPSPVAAARSTPGGTTHARSRTPDQDAAYRRAGGHYPARGRRFPGGAFAIHDPSLRAYDKTTGKVVGEVPLPRNATAAPMTYLLNGEQYIVVATGAPICLRNSSRCACRQGSTWIEAQGRARRHDATVGGSIEARFAAALVRQPVSAAQDKSR